jgi:uncharacterized protein
MKHVLPFRQFVLKVHSRCDLACDHCYVYEHADQSWRGQPKAISVATATRVAQRIAEHAAAHQLAGVHVVLHGGEPLLLGVERTRTVLSLLREQIEPVTRLDLRVHTNGVILDADFCGLFDEFGVRVGISLDGDRASNDRHRRFANGKTSHPHVLRALELLRSPQFAHLYAGILCTIDLANDPSAVYQALAAERPPRVDLLLPHATWDTPPARKDASRPEYAEWLIAVYERWRADGAPFPIRTFDSIHAALRGEPSKTESLGLTPTDLLVIETDGTIEQADSLKTAFDGAAATGLNVVDHTLDEAAEHEGIEARQHGLVGLCGTCRVCPVVDVCGGGLYAHRFRSDTGFANPSVYCDDLKATILHVRSRTDAAAEESAHTIPAAELDTLASGYGSGEAVRRLAESQDSIRRNLISTLIAATGSNASVAAAGDLLAGLDASAPQAVQTVLGHPRTREWANACLDAMQGADAQGEGLRYLNAIAAAAAVHARAAAELTVPVVAGAVRLPTVGSFPTSGQADAVVCVAASGLTITCGTDLLRLEFDDPTPDPAWQPVYRLTAEGFDVSLEDVGSGLDGRGAAVRHLSATDAKAWQARFADAIDLLTSSVPRYVPGLRAGLSTLVPLGGEKLAPAGRTAGEGFGAFDAFGTIRAALPQDPATLALLLVRGFQRVKLGAILDLFPLFDRSATGASYRVAWLPGPLPLTELFGEAYAAIGVTEFWRATRAGLGAQARTGADADAEAKFDRWRRDTADAVGQLRHCADLTAVGWRFVDGMARTAETWFDEGAAKSRPEEGTGREARDPQPQPQPPADTGASRRDETGALPRASR